MVDRDEKTVLVFRLTIVSPGPDVEEVGTNCAISHRAYKRVVEAVADRKVRLRDVVSDIATDVLLRWFGEDSGLDTRTVEREVVPDDEL